MRIEWRKIAVAGVVAYCAGKVVGRLRRHPEVVLPIIQTSIASGVVGGLVGWGVAVQRNAPPRVLSLSLGANFSIFTGSFLCIRKVVHTTLVDHAAGMSPDNEWSPAVINYTSSTLSGGSTGALTALIARLGLYSMLLSSLGGMGMGLCAQVGYDQVMKWHKRKAIRIHGEEILGIKEKGLFDDWTLENFERRFLGFWHQRSESIAMEMEMLGLETAVVEEKKKLARLDQELRERGLSLDLLDTGSDDLDITDTTFTSARNDNKESLAT